MEISKDEPIFKAIKTMETYISADDTSTNEYIIHIQNDNGSWTETEFTNFINSLRFSYKETIADERLEITNMDGIKLNIYKMKNILLYCNTNNYKLTEYKWSKKTLIINLMIHQTII